MPFILPCSFPQYLVNIRSEYEKRTKQVLDPSKQPNVVFRFFGAKDVVMRDNYIHLLENLYQILAPKLTSQSDHISTEQINEYFNALRILVAAVFYIKQDIDNNYHLISNHSVLNQILNELIAHSKKNALDPETSTHIFLTTKEFIEKLFTQIQTSDIGTLISNPEWEKMVNYIQDKCEELNKPVCNYPIASTCMGIVGRPMAAAGYALGYTIGEVIAGSTITLATGTGLTAIVSSTLYLIGGTANPMGVMLVAPTYARLLLQRYSGVTLAWILGTIMRTIGNAIGGAFGASVDGLYYLTCRAFAYLTEDPSLPPITGFNLVNGQCYIKGEPLTKETAEEFFAKMQRVQIHTTENGVNIVVDSEDQNFVNFDTPPPTYVEQPNLAQIQTQIEADLQGFLASSRPVTATQQNHEQHYYAVQA